jgi:hypothetical protein
MSAEKQRRALLAGILFVSILACRSKPGIVDTRGVTVRVDSAVYHLQEPSSVYYVVNLVATVTNGSPKTIYLSQFCGSWALRRADTTDHRLLMLGSYACFAASFKFPKPLSVAAGQTYSHAFKLSGSNSPDTRPRLTIDDQTGSMVFIYGLADSTGRPIGSVKSLPFRVEPPRPQDHADALTRWEMIAFERGLAYAFDRREKLALDTLIADSWTITSLDGTRSDKRTAIARMTKPLLPGIVSEKKVVDSVSVQRLSADSAVVTASIAQIEEKVYHSDTVVVVATDIVARHAGRWRVVASRESLKR